jgi:hypothetical protein
MSPRWRSYANYCPCFIYLAVFNDIRAVSGIFNMLLQIVQLFAKKRELYQNKIDTFLQFFHAVKPSYER